MFRRVAGRRTAAVLAAPPSTSVRSMATSRSVVSIVVGTSGVSTSASTSGVPASVTSSAVQVRHQGQRGGPKRKNFQPFTEDQEKQLAEVLTTNPRHVARHIRQQILFHSKRANQFRSTVTWLMMSIQQKLESNELNADIAALMIEDVLHECVKIRAGEMAHLLFRAGLRFRKYGLKLTVPSVRCVFKAYRNQENAAPNMRGLAEEMEEHSEMRPLVMAAFLFGNQPGEAARIRESIPEEDFTTEDYLALVDGYSMSHRSSDIDALARKMGALSSGTTDKVDRDQVFSHCLARCRKQPERETLLQLGLESNINFSDQAILSYIKDPLRNINKQRALLAYEATLKERFKVKELGMAVVAALISRNVHIVTSANQKADATMLTKVEHLHAVVDAQLTNDDLDNLDPQFVISLLKGYGVLGEMDKMRQIFEVCRKKTGIVTEHAYEEVLYWYSMQSNVKEVIKLKEQMTQDNLYITSNAYGHILYALGKFYPRMVKSTWNEIQRTTKVLSRFLFGALVSVFTALEDAEVLEKLYEELMGHQTRSGALQEPRKFDDQLAAAKKGNLGKRPEKNADGYSPRAGSDEKKWAQSAKVDISYDLASPKTLKLLIKAFENKPSRCRQIIALGEQLGFMTSPIFQSACLRYYQVHGMDTDFKKLVKALPAETVDAQLALLQGYANTQDRAAYGKLVVRIREQLNNQLTPRILKTVIWQYAKWEDKPKVNALLGELKEMQTNRDSHYYEMAIEAFAKFHDHVGVDTIWEDISSQKAHPVGMVVYNKLLNIYMKWNMMGRMQEVLDHMMKNVPPNPVTTTTILDMLGRMGRLSEMEALLDEMSRSRDVKPTVITFHTVISAFGRVGDIAKVEQLRAKMRRAEIQENHVTYNILLDAYANAKRFEHVKDLRKEMKQRNIQLDEPGFKVLMGIYGKGRMGPELDGIVAEGLATMKNKRGGISPGFHLSVANAYSFLGDEEKVTQHTNNVLKAFDEALGKKTAAAEAPSTGELDGGVSPDTQRQQQQDEHLVTLNTVERVFIMFHRLKKTDRLGQLLEKYSGTSKMYNICLTAYAKEQDHLKVAELLDTMEKKKFVLDANTSITLSSLLLKAGKLELARAVLQLKTAPEARHGTEAEGEKVAE